MSKFKIGDLVRVASYRRSLSVPHLTITEAMRRIVGRECKVGAVDVSDDTVQLAGVFWWYHEDDLELVEA